MGYDKMLGRGEETDNSEFFDNYSLGDDMASIQEVIDFPQIEQHVFICDAFS
jgi:hypothetical protein